MTAARATDEAAPDAAGTHEVDLAQLGLGSSGEPDAASELTRAERAYGPLAGTLAPSAPRTAAPVLEAVDPAGEPAEDAQAPDEVHIAATTPPRSTRVRTLLLLLMLSVLSSIAIWTPAGLQSVTATAFELLLKTEVQPIRTSPGPGPLVGQLDVTSTPSGAELFVDGDLRGVTPIEMVLNAGPHELTFVSELGTVRRRVRVRPGYRTLYGEAIFPGSLVIPVMDTAEV